MRRCSFTISLQAVVMLVGCTVGFSSDRLRAAEEPPPRPNIVLILADDK